MDFKQELERIANDPRIAKLRASREADDMETSTIEDLLEHVPEEDDAEAKVIYDVDHHLTWLRTFIERGDAKNAAREAYLLGRSVGQLDNRP